MGEFERMSHVGLCRKHGNLDCQHITCKRLGVKGLQQKTIVKAEPVDAPKTYTSDELNDMSKDEATKIAINLDLDWKGEMDKPSIIALILGGSSQ